MKSRGWLVIFMLISVSACQSLSARQVSPVTQSGSDTTPTQTAKPSSTPPPAPTLTPTYLPALTPLPAPTLTDPMAHLRRSLLEALESVDWRQLGMSAERLAAFTNYAHGSGDLPPPEIQLAEDFVDQWSVFAALIEAGKSLPVDAIPGFRLREIRDDKGEVRLLVYVLDKETSHAGDEALFLAAHDQNGQILNLVRSADIDGLTRQPGADGQSVDYFDPKGNLIIRAEARWLDSSIARQSSTLFFFHEMRVHSDYQSSSIYPRYILNIPNIHSYFYGLEALSYNQILLLRDTLNLFNRDSLVQLAGDVFAAGDQVEYVVTNEPHQLAAAFSWPMGGTPPNGIIILYARNLFHNLYLTAATIAHEATHIWQGSDFSCDEPDKMLAREIGDRTIPSGFYSWTAEELIQAARQGRIGAYHVDMWVLLKLNQAYGVELTKQIIQTGSSDGVSLLYCQ